MIHTKAHVCAPAIAIADPAAHVASTGENIIAHAISHTQRTVRVEIFPNLS